MESAEVAAKDRERVDRRRLTWRTFVYGFLRSRRRSHRRDDDSDVVFLDWHHPWLFCMAIGTMLLSCADAFLTLELLARGMIEVNPVMNALLDSGTRTFAATKLTMTALGIFVLVFLAKLRFLNRFRTGLFLTLFFAMYACLVCYEFVNLIELL